VLAIANVSCCWELRPLLAAECYANGNQGLALDLAWAPRTVSFWLQDLGAAWCGNAHLLSQHLKAWGRGSWVQGHLGYITRPCLKKPRQTEDKKRAGSLKSLVLRATNCDPVSLLTQPSGCQHWGSHTSIREFPPAVVSLNLKEPLYPEVCESIFCHCLFYFILFILFVVLGL
jgi:hypothetical protein